MAAALDVSRRMMAGLSRPATLGVYANAFPPQGEDAEANVGLSPIRADLDPPRYLDFARAWMDRGAGIVGGCCGIGPEHIKAIREAVDAR
jgi:S-methylmethionine-dependent homocysteine/selenocysteine methylase